VILKLYTCEKMTSYSVGGNVLSLHVLQEVTVTNFWIKLMDPRFLYSGVRQGRRVGVINSREFRVKLKVSSITMSKPYFMKIHKSLQKLSGGTDVEARTLSHKIHFRIRRWHKNISFSRKDLIRRCVIVATALLSLNSLWFGQDYSVMFVKLGTISG
jgi:hypothetical protein